MGSGERRTRWIRFLAGMVVAAAAGVVVFYVYEWTRPKPFVAKARFLIVPDRPSFLDKPDLDYDRRNEIFRQTQLTYIKSKEVMLSALREPGIAALAVLVPCPDKAEWMLENMHAELLAADVDEDRDGLVDKDSRILQIEIRGTEDQADDLRLLVRAVSTAYMQDVTYKDQQRVAESRDAEQRALYELRAVLLETIEKRNALREEHPEALADLEVIGIEIDELTAVFRQLISRQQLKELASDIGHVRQLEPLADVPTAQGLFKPWSRN
ncbi:MAG: hypothetical protein AB7G28_23355 [Pirellulales bacterium]